jgi:hypothetical protein
VSISSCANTASGSSTIETSTPFRTGGGVGVGLGVGFGVTFAVGRVVGPAVVAAAPEEEAPGVGSMVGSAVASAVGPVVGWIDAAATRGRGVAATVSRVGRSGGGSMSSATRAITRWNA